LKKSSKKLFYPGPWALARPKPMAWIQTSFCVAFFKKRLLPLME
jgi:hypothetical protein